MPPGQAAVPPASIEIVVPAHNEARRLPDGLAALCRKAASAPAARRDPRRGQREHRRNGRARPATGPRARCRSGCCAATGRARDSRCGPACWPPGPRSSGSATRTWPPTCPRWTPRSACSPPGNPLVIGSRGLAASVVTAGTARVRRAGAAAFRRPGPPDRPGRHRYPVRVQVLLRAAGPRGGAAAADGGLRLRRRADRHLPAAGRDADRDPGALAGHAGLDVLGAAALARPRSATSRRSGCGSGPPGPRPPRGRAPASPLLRRPGRHRRARRGASTSAEAATRRRPWARCSRPGPRRRDTAGTAPGPERRADRHRQLARPLAPAGRRRRALRLGDRPRPGRPGATVCFLTARAPGQARRDHRDGIKIVRLGGRFTVYPLVLGWLLRAPPVVRRRARLPERHPVLHPVGAAPAGARAVRDAPRAHRSVRRAFPARGWRGPGGCSKGRRRGWPTGGTPAWRSRRPPSPRCATRLRWTGDIYLVPNGVATLPAGRRAPDGGRAHRRRVAGLGGAAGRAQAGRAVLPVARAPGRQRAHHRRGGPRPGGRTSWPPPSRPAAWPARSGCTASCPRRTSRRSWPDRCCT